MDATVPALLCAQQIEGGPDITSIDTEGLAEARKLSVTNKPHSFKLVGWKPLQTKPRKQELWQVILERDSTQKPQFWSVEKMVKHLTEPPKPSSANHNGVLTSALAHVVATEDGAQDVAPNAIAVALPEESGSKPRWSRNKCVCVIHIICSEDLKTDFINRDRKLDRQEMDAKGMDSFWEKAANVFNSTQTFDIDKHKGTDRFKTLSAAPTTYVADATKLKSEFGQMRAALTKALTNFRKSGMGDGEADEGDELIMSSDFRDFCMGDEVLEYMEFMFRKADILDLATCNMPDGADFSSDSTRRSCTTGPQPKPNSSGKKRKSLDDTVAAFQAVLQKLPPLKLHKTSAQKSAEQAQQIRQLLKTHQGLGKMLSKQSDQLTHTEDTVRRLELDDVLDPGGLHSHALKHARQEVAQTKRVISIITNQRVKLIEDLSNLEIVPSAPSDEDEDAEDVEEGEDAFGDGDDL